MYENSAPGEEGGPEGVGPGDTARASGGGRGAGLRRPVPATGSPPRGKPWAGLAPTAGAATHKGLVKSPAVAGDR